MAFSVHPLAEKFPEMPAYLAEFEKAAQAKAKRVAFDSLAAEMEAEQDGASMGDTSEPVV
jgi:hypothetical protein